MVAHGAHTPTQPSEAEVLITHVFWVEPSQASQATQSKEFGGHRHPRLRGIDGWDETTLPAVLMGCTECDQGTCPQGQKAENGKTYFHGNIPRSWCVVAGKAFRDHLL